MRFSMKQWRKLYHEINTLGQKLKDFHYATKVPEGKRLSRDTVYMIQNDISALLDRTKRYLDGCGMSMPATAWQYSFDDKTTWPSHESFRYYHLLDRRW